MPPIILLYTMYDPYCTKYGSYEGEPLRNGVCVILTLITPHIDLPEKINQRKEGETGNEVTYMLMKNLHTSLGHIAYTKTFVTISK